MARKLILDMDPGIDDAVALCLALADPRLEVVAVTATGGNVGPEQASRNLLALLEQLDPPRRPRIGVADQDQILRADARHLYGADGLCGCELPLAELHHQHAAVKVISDEVRNAPGEVTIVATGPLSNLAVALQREPDLAPLIGHLIMLGGTVTAPGNITAAAEFNFFCDAAAAKQVFRSPLTKTLIPLDVSRQLMFDFSFLDKLPAEQTRTGKLLRQLLPGAYRAYRQRLGMEGIYLHDAVAVVAALHPELFTMQGMHGDVETEGDLTHGATVFDRRPYSDALPNMEVAVEVDANGVMDCIIRVLQPAF